MKSKNIRNLLSTWLFAAAVSAALIVPGAAPAFEAKLSGQVSRMVVLPDDAVGDEIQHQDIGWSGSRFRFTGSEEADNGLTWGFRFEIQARNNNAGTNGGQLGNNGDNQDNRYQDLYLSGDFGRISFGKGDGASNGGTEVDMSGTALASAAPLQDNWGDLRSCRTARNGARFSPCLTVSAAKTVCGTTPQASMVLLWRAVSTREMRPNSRCATAATSVATNSALPCLSIKPLT